MSPEIQQHDIYQPEDLHNEVHRACLAGEAVHVQQCDACGTYRHPPRWLCPACHSDRFSLAALGGTGTVGSAAVTHFSVEPAWQAKVPYAAVIVELDEGPRVVGELRDLAASDLVIGQRVRVDVEAHGERAHFVVRPHREGERR